MKKVICSLCLLGSLVASMAGSAAPKMALIPFWDASVASNSKQIDHSRWQQFLTQYVQRDPLTKINLVAYGAVSAGHKASLETYLDALQGIDPRQYSRAEQKAYWINFYNALTVNLILDHYPVESITDIHEGFFSFGPWNDVIAQVAGESLTLNDIEHGVLRPIFKDARIHYALNCASMSCPDLALRAFTRENTEALLQEGATVYINHPRGVAFKKGRLQVSSIYDWYGDDFGASEKELMAHFERYARPELLEGLKAYQKGINFDYDWALNDKK